MEKKVFMCSYSRDVMSFTHHCRAVVVADSIKSAYKTFTDYLKEELGQKNLKAIEVDVSEIKEDLFIISQGSN
jgi:hypothetical protein